MTRRARNPVMYGKYSEHYVAEPAKYEPDPNRKAYHMIPQNYPKIMGMGPKSKGRCKAPYPDGLVDIYGSKGITGPVVRELTPGYLDRIFKGKSTVSDRQNYINKVISNPRSPTKNIKVAVQYVRDKPYLFTPAEQSPDYPDDVNYRIRIHNGNDPEMSFVSRISALFPRMWSR
ncbi:hypothetical protein AUP07_0410 [methanogenic archaeon mixed culture ISO4-G1]|nr:hypothetical protein AUP07_0410 [methanogenic archaeon mixed culture ISO4-G1]